VLEIATMERNELTHRNFLRTATTSTWTEMTLHSYVVEQYWLYK